MPVVFVVDTQTHTKVRVRRMLEAANRAVSSALDVPRNSVWVRYDPGKPGNYWEGETGDVPEQGRPVFVFVKMLKGRDPKKIKSMFGKLSSAVGGALGIIPEYVWMRVEEMDADRVGQGAQSYAELRRKK